MDRIHPLRAWRERHGVTLTALASRVGVKPSHISEIERDLNGASLTLAGKLSRETIDGDGRPEVPLDEFLRPEATNV